MKKSIQIPLIKIKHAFFVLFFVAIIAPFSIFGQPFDKAEFAARRAKFFEKIGDGVAIVFANERHPFSVKFRQSPDFYYLTGIEEPDAILVLFGKGKQTFLFAPKLPQYRVSSEGPGILNLEKPADIYGLTRVLPMEDFYLHLSRRLPNDTKLYVPLSPPDDLQFGRDEVRNGEAERLSYSLFAGISRIKHAIDKLRQWQPQVTLADVSPIMDELRWIKTPYEIERMRMSGKIGAEGVKEAMKGTKPGMYEYEIEAAARFVFVKRGARGDAFMPIVASGPNTLILHYTKNNRQMQAGDVVYMDYGADYDYYTSDITRTWAVSGKFTPEQEKMYRCILETRNVIIGMMKPGIRVTDLEKAARVVYKKHGFEKEFLETGEYVGHYIGISVHDVGYSSQYPNQYYKPFVPGVVFNVEPLIQNKEQKIHMRLEDTVLITASGAENLTAGVPAELEEVYALTRQQPISINVK